MFTNIVNRVVNNTNLALRNRPSIGSQTPSETI